MRFLFTSAYLIDFDTREEAEEARSRMEESMLAQARTTLRGILDDNYADADERAEVRLEMASRFVHLGVAVVEMNGEMLVLDE